jgi:energy-coupling factor transport system permease protein
VSGLFQTGAGPLHRLHPLTKLTFSAFAAAWALAGPAYWSATAVFLSLFLIALWGGVGRNWARQNGRLLTPLLLMLFLLHGFFHPQGETVLLTLWRFSLTSEGLAFATLLSNRIAAIVGATLLLLLTTRPAELLTALQQRGFPPALAYIISSTLTLLPQMRAKAGAITQAQQARGLSVTGSIWQRARALPPLLTPLVLGALVESEERAIALEARAFRVPGPKTTRAAPADSARQRRLRGLLLIGIVLLIGWRIWHWLLLTI